MNHRLQAFQQQVGGLLESFLKEQLETLEDIPKSLREALAYALLGPGKKFRPLVVFGVGQLFDLPEEQLVRLAASVELVHAYSLIHDDLPAMDDAPLRRGRPSCHLAFSEGLAILAGDALIPMAFEVLTDPQTHPLAEMRLEACRLLAQAIGPLGMVGGQVLDVTLTKDGVDADRLTRIQLLKTGALFSYCVQAPATFAQASKEHCDALQRYSNHLALVFQMADDVLETADATTTGKQHGSGGGLTWPHVIGRQATLVLRDKTLQEALQALDCFGERGQMLRDLVTFAAHRSY